MSDTTPQTEPSEPLAAANRAAVMPTPPDFVVVAPTANKRRLITNLFGVMGMVALGGGALAVGSGFAAPRTATDKIVPGIQVANATVAGPEVGDLTPDAAREKVRQWAREQTAKPIVLIAPQTKRRWEIPLAETGGWYDVDAIVDKAIAVGTHEDLFTRILRNDRPRNIKIAPVFKFHDEMLQHRLVEIAKAVQVPPKNARAAMHKGVIVVAKPEQKGVTLDIAATKAALLKDGLDSLQSGKEINLIINEAAPRVTSADIGKIGTQLASFTTDFSSSSSDRQHNVRKAASAIDGTLLAPGEIFSYNETVGPRDLALGWRNAPTYQDGQVVPGPGGGVCQVSTTLYNAVLRAGLKIVRRSHHSMPVHYVPAGRDATVAYDDIDFKFQNNTDGLLFIDGGSSDGRLRFNLYGKTPAVAKKVDLETSRRRELPSGAFTVSTWRIIKAEDGKAVREHLSTDTYQPYKPPTGDAKHGDRKIVQHVRRRRKPVVVAPAVLPANPAKNLSADLEAAAPVVVPHRHHARTHTPHTTKVASDPAPLSGGSLADHVR